MKTAYDISLVVVVRLNIQATHIDVEDILGDVKCIMLVVMIEWLYWAEFFEETICAKYKSGNVPFRMIHIHVEH